MNIEFGRCYRGKKPKCCAGFLVDDRQVKWVSPDRTKVQYDSPSVRDGMRYPTVTMDKFVAWASHDITDDLPEGEWANWPIAKAQP